MATQPDPPEYNPEGAWERDLAAHGSLAAALAAFQAEIPSIAKNRTAKIPPRDGKAGWDYQYADLADVTAQVLPLLGKHGLAFTARPTLTGEGKFVLAYSLIHVSGELIDGEYPLPSVSNPQQLGSAITYARRYALCAVTGAAAEADDDGAAATQPEQPKRPQKRRQPRAEANGHDETPQKPAKPKDRNPAGLIAMHMQRLGITDRAERLIKTSILAERTEPIESTNDLSDEKLEHVLDEISKCKDRAALDAKLQKAREKVPAS